ncbi:uncharacterized protein PG998_006744 [Apiospora kogelbergensis]|uniref:uncharacterized protein n=1 Tax=Apiospora kogelbergensis TaxID=1337665 RepID=UPI00312DB313
MCQEVKEDQICATCGICFDTIRMIEKCSEATRRGNAGRCSRRIVAHRGSHLRDERVSCESCVAAYHQQMVNSNDNYQNDYTW